MLSLLTFVGKIAPRIDRINRMKKKFVLFGRTNLNRVAVRITTTMTENRMPI